MASIYDKAGRSKLWMRVRDERGEWTDKPTPYSACHRGDARKGCTDCAATLKNARRFADRAQENIDRRVAANLPPKHLTLRRYFAQWLPTRREADLDWRHDETRMRLHVLPSLGDMLLSDVRAKHVADLIHRLRSTPLKTTGKKPGQRTVHNVYGVLSALFRDAVIAGVVEQTPCVLDARQLGPVIDKDPEWRDGAVCARGEVERLISDERIAADQRVHYAIGFLAGLRHGEVAALRWRHYDVTVGPLGKLIVATSYSTEKRRAKGTKTNVVRYVPVHPTLAAILAEWRIGGWARMMGRSPTSDDLILPLPPAHQVRRSAGQRGDSHRDSDYSYKRWCRDLKALGLRHRRAHDARATFVTLALDDGADPNVVERLTHPPKSRSAFGLYNRGTQWAIACREVSKLKVARRSTAALAAALATAAPLTVDKLRASGGTRTPTRLSAAT
ncbi:MAG: Mx8p12A [Myxococcales bacterium]|nr:Mx8p12A [Myxococcales bacterium]